MKRTAVVACEDEIELVSPHRTERDPLVELTCPVLAERGDRARIEGDDAPASTMRSSLRANVPGLQKAAERNRRLPCPCDLKHLPWFGASEWDTAASPN